MATKYLPYFFVLIVSANSASAQAQSSNQYYRSYFTGCWQSNAPKDGYLITFSDQTFQWIKPTERAFEGNDTLRGTWDIRSVFGIPFKADIIRLKFRKGRKKKYQIGTTSMPAVIYLDEGAQFLKVPCK